MEIEELNAFLRAAMPLSETLDIVATEMTTDTARMTVEWDADLCTADGVLHGGVLMALADTCGATLAFANLPDGAVATSTIESKTNFLGAVTEGAVTATSTPLHVGRTTIVVETELHHGDRLVAKTTQTQAILYPKAP